MQVGKGACNSANKGCVSISARIAVWDFLDNAAHIIILEGFTKSETYLNGLVVFRSTGLDVESKGSGAFEATLSKRRHDRKGKILLFMRMNGIIVVGMNLIVCR